MRYGLSLAALAVALVTGCNKSPEGGGSGSGSSSANTFTISAPDLRTTVKQGETRSVKITLNRGKDFKQNVKLKAETVGDKVKAKFEKETFAATDPADASLMVEVAKDATEGDQTIKVTGTPDSGNPTSVEVKIAVAKGP